LDAQIPKLLVGVATILPASHHSNQSFFATSQELVGAALRHLKRSDLIASPVGGVEIARDSTDTTAINDEAEASKEDVLQETMEASKDGFPGFDYWYCQSTMWSMVCGMPIPSSIHNNNTQYQRPTEHLEH
jgi:hypothetical protein